MVMGCAEDGTAKAEGWRSWSLAFKEFAAQISPMEADSEPALCFGNNPLAQAILREGRLIQERFVAGPVYAKTAKAI